MAAKAGKDVYCEKPVSLTIHESRVMVDTFRRHNRIFQGGFQQRSVDDFAAARRLIQNGRIGTLKNIHCHWFGTSQALNLPPETPSSPASTGICGSARRPSPTSLQQPLSPGRSTGLWDRPVGYPARLRGRQHHVQWLASHLDIAQWVMGMDDSGPI